MSVSKRKWSLSARATAILIVAGVRSLAGTLVRGARKLCLAETSNPTDKHAYLTCTFFSKAFSKLVNGIDK